MSEEKPKTQFYTLPVDYVYDLADKSHEQISILKDMLVDYFSPESNKEGVIPSFVKLLWVNYAMLEIVDGIISEPVSHVNEETGEDEFMIDEKTLLTMQSYMLTRYHTSGELKRLSYSLELN